MLVGNGASPANPVFEAAEGDIMEITLQNEAAVPISMLW